MIPPFARALALCLPGLLAWSLAAAQEPPECETKRHTIRAGEMMCNDFKNAQACMLLEQERRAAAAMGCSGSGGGPTGAMGGRQPDATPSGAIGDPAMLSRERVYDDQCVRKIPRTDVERAQCQQLYRAINPATNSGPMGAPPPRSGGGAGMHAERPAGNAGTTPVDEAGRSCVTLVDQTEERIVANSVTRKYHFRNGCNAPMEIVADAEYANMPPQTLTGYVCPGKTTYIYCQENNSSRSCLGVRSYSARPYASSLCR